jgi:cyclopropane-fatty-acyl-phospholipid synthase
MKTTIIPAARFDVQRPSGTALQRLGRRILLRQFERLDTGEIILVESGRRHCFGARTAGCGLAATIEVDDPQFWADVVFGGTLGAGESFIRGAWRCTDLTALVRILVLNRGVVDGLEGGWSWVSAPLQRLLHFLNRNTRHGSRRNIAAHYDLGNDFFELFLDRTMAYSCGIFADAHTSLEAASLAKFDTALRKLDLGPAHHLLEVGTGWGGLAVHAAAEYGCRVTTITISKEQYAHARARIARAGLDDRIDLRLLDYRDLQGTYDRIVSIEMIEAVGHDHLETYFAKCSDLLAPDGAMLLQAITLQDQLYEEALKRVDFIQRFIFPGSFIPSITALLTASTRSSDMKLAHLEDIGSHYATTLRRWRDGFAAASDRVTALGYPPEFKRMWEFYLSYCEGGFAERQLGDVQMLLLKPHSRIRTWAL